MTENSVSEVSVISLTNEMSNAIYVDIYYSIHIRRTEPINSKNMENIYIFSIIIVFIGSVLMI